MLPIELKLSWAFDLKWAGANALRKISSGLRLNSVKPWIYFDSLYVFIRNRFFKVLNYAQVVICFLFLAFFHGNVFHG